MMIINHHKFAWFPSQSHFENLMAREDFYERVLPTGMLCGSYSLGQWNDVGKAHVGRWRLTQATTDVGHVNC